eukprot:7383720-Alexandrium_andersonii.AAC.1
MYLRQALAWVPLRRGRKGLYMVRLFDFENGGVPDRWPRWLPPAESRDIDVGLLQNSETREGASPEFDDQPE